MGLDGRFGGLDPDGSGSWWLLTHALTAGLGTLFLLALLGVTAWMLWRALRESAARRQLVARPEPTALEQLRLRYVRGEIDALTFEEMTERLMASEHLDRPWLYDLPRDQPPAAL
ncbi:MAG TPA: hypothetical protein VGS80_17185 [Ktedonobacterales bacterium]|nr:hypothetical protein [Ktedonobacterales bacterium]